MESEYPKLVRDNIPEIIKKREGFEPSYRILKDDTEFLNALLKKATEEATELQHSLEKNNTEEEIADAEEKATDAEVAGKIARNKIVTESFIVSDKQVQESKKKNALEDKQAEQQHQRDVVEYIKLEQMKEQAVNEGLSGIASLLDQAASKNKEFANAAKAVNIAQAIMNTYLGATKAEAEYPPPFGEIAAVGVVAAGLANVAKISAQSFQTPYGGTKTVPGGVNMAVPIIAHGGEKIGGRGSGDTDGMHLHFHGDYFESESANAQLFNRVYRYQKRTGLRIQPA